jgi:2-polyprenyl-3-methyl-5-hydroxy-6-metoxy-1,4-benzoquinol methylase
MREVEALARRAQEQLARSEHGPALESLASALRLAPQLDALWAQLAEVIRFFNLRHPVPAFVRELLARALDHPAVDPGDLVRPVSTLALSHPDGPLAEPLLLRLMEDTVIRDARLELAITTARRRMLEDETAVAIAHQCFNTEYVFDESPEEVRQLSPQRPVAYAAYRPLHTLGAVQVPPSLQRRQIDEPLQERRLAATIPALTGVQSDVSAAVQAQYEANPYPRWIRAPATFPQFASDAKKILVAGCGTGQHAIATARCFPAAEVLAIDLSRASLAYAMRKTIELGVTNVQYRQADILALGGLAERFDLIECLGVLHHLEHPLDGWRVLRSLLKPGGSMRIGLYSELGRRSVVAARALIAEHGWRADAEGIRACRAAIRADPRFPAIAANEDFYSMSGCRDLLFHVQEHRFTLPQIEAMLAELGLDFLGFEFADSGAALRRYQERFSDPRNLRHWHELEQQYPDTFSRMYQFWVR